jgi:hypothetical protein
MEALLGEWLNNIAGPQYASAVMWTLGALVVLVIVLLLVRAVRRISSGTFVAGGRNRRARLAVMDAAAIDNQRRLVLVRRDDVEHLILIGGPTDVVVEQNIVPGAALHTPPLQTGSNLPNGRDTPPAPRPSPATPEPAPVLREEPAFTFEEPEPQAPKPVSAQLQRAEPAISARSQAPVAAPPPAQRASGEPAAHSGSVHFLDQARISPAPQAAASMAPLAPLAERPNRNETVRPAETRAPEISTPGQEAAAPEPVLAEADRKIEPLRREARGGDLDSALREELKAPLVNEPETQPAAEPSLEEEMKRLLGELSMPARN